MKYKVGDTVYLKGIVDEIDEDDSLDIHVDFGKGSSEWFNHNAIRTSDLLDKTYEQGLQDAWELAKKVWTNDDRENQEMFGTLVVKDIFSFAPQEALAKLKAYEEEKEIKVGDVVKVENEKVLFVVLAIYGNDVWSYKIGDNRLPLQSLTMDMITKTGKHIDIAGLLEQIKGE